MAWLAWYALNSFLDWNGLQWTELFSKLDWVAIGWTSSSLACTEPVSWLNSICWCTMNQFVFNLPDRKKSQELTFISGRNFFSKNVELTSPFFTLQRFGPGVHWTSFMIDLDILVCTKPVSRLTCIAFRVLNHSLDWPG